MCNMTHLYVCHPSFTSVTWLVHMCDMTHSYVWHDSFICVTWLIHMCDMNHSRVWHDSFICVIWLAHMRGMTHLYVRHGAFMCATKTHAYVRHDSFMCVTQLIHMCNTTHSCVRQLLKIKRERNLFFVRAPLQMKTEEKKLRIEGAYGVAASSRLLKVTGLFCKRDLKKRRYSAKETFTLKDHMNESCPTHEWVMSHTWMRHVPHRITLKERTNRRHPKVPVATAHDTYVWSHRSFVHVPWQFRCRDH